MSRLRRLPSDTEGHCRVPARLASLMLALTVALPGCHAGPGADHYVAVADTLAFPDDWQREKSLARGPDQEDPCAPSFAADCPGAVRWFSVQGDAIAAYTNAKQVVEAAGFSVVEEFHEGCTGRPSGPACAFVSDRETDRILVNVFHSLAAAGLGDHEPGTAGVIVSVYGNE